MIFLLWISMDNGWWTVSNRKGALKMLVAEMLIILVFLVFQVSMYLVTMCFHYVFSFGVRWKWSLEISWKNIHVKLYTSTIKICLVFLILEVNFLLQKDSEKWLHKNGRKIKKRKTRGKTHLQGSEFEKEWFRTLIFRKLRIQYTSEN